jgi:hypothetical protein
MKAQKVHPDQARAKVSMWKVGSGRRTKRLLGAGVGLGPVFEVGLASEARVRKQLAFDPVKGSRTSMRDSASGSHQEHALPN